MLAQTLAHHKILEKIGEGVLTDLEGRRGHLGTQGLATDGRYLYFRWEEELGDIWVMDVVQN
jgi:hypothetical protein